MTRKAFFLDQHGCAKNQIDGEIIVTRLKRLGLERVSDAAEADLIVINSCGFIESAKRESLDSLMSARRAYPGARILLAGCLAERYADVFRTELPEADGILGNGDLALVDKAAEEVLAGRRPVLKAPQRGVCSEARTDFLSFKGSAYVKITEGCDNRCSFCAIPLIRGPLRSRAIEEIVSEIQSLLARGVFEINLVGQDIASYGRGKDDDVFAGNRSGETEDADPLRALLERISSLPGRFWVRLLYMHPDSLARRAAGVPEGAGRTVLDGVLGAMRRDARILPYFDIPFQSGDDGVIRAMNRRGIAVSYEALAESIRASFPGACIRTTFLAGFPGETDEAAAHTMRFLESLQSDWSGCFTYSREEGTPAYSMKGRVPRRTADARAEALRDAQSAITERRLAKRLGRVYDVLIEEVIEGGEGGESFAIGRPWFCAPEVDGAFVVRYGTQDAARETALKEGAVVRARALSVAGVDITGELAE